MSYADTNKTILEALRASVRDWYQITINDEINAALQLDDVLRADMVELRRVRWYALNVAEIEKLWKRYVSPDDREVDGEVRESLFDFYVNGGTYLWMDNPVTDANKTAFLGHMSSTLTWFGRSPLIPTTYRDFACTAEDMQGYLSSNPWIMFLVIMSMTKLEYDDTL